MNLVFIIKNRDETPFMVVRTTPNGSTFEPMSDSAKDLAKMLRQEYGKTPITKPELVQTMDASKIIEGPSPSGTATQKKVANISIVEKKLQTLPVLSISEVLLSEFSNEEFKNVLTFKASSFISDQTRSSAHFEIKGVRAIWDPSLSIPGTNRRGGFRCPVGTRYGGQITDRFGRSCGWGVARRIANQIADIGERLEQRDDNKRKRRLDRRNARMIRRLGGVAETGRIEGGLRNVAERLEGGKPQQRGNLLERVNNEGLAGVINRRINRGRRRDEPTPEVEAPARVPRNRRRDVIPETAPSPRGAPQRTVVPQIPRLEGPQGSGSMNLPGGGRGIRTPQELNPRPRPAARRLQPRPRVTPQAGDVDVLTARDASDAGETEDFKPYVLRKYDEYAQRVREIREGGGNAGMLTRREWYAINKENLRDAWKDAHGRSAPQDFEPPTPQARRPRNNRGRRRQATAQGAGRATTRKPTPDDVPEPAPARPVRPARRNKVAEEQAARNALQNALTEANQDPGYVLVNEKFDKDVEAILRQPQAVPEKKLDELIGMLEEQENQIRARNRRARQMGQPPDPDDVAMLQRLSPQHRKLREARTAARLARNASSAPSSRQSAPTPKTPVTPPTPPQAPVPQGQRKPSLDEEAAKRINGRVSGRLKKSKASRFNKNHGHVEIDGILVPEGVKKGNANINTAQDAIGFVANGGDLDDVPDIFVKDAILRNANYPNEPAGAIPKRFKLKKDPGNGINNRGARNKENKTYLVTDTVSGKKYILKSPSYVQNEFVGEQYAAIIGQALGRPMSRVRLAGDIKNMQNVNGAMKRNAPILVEHYGDVVEGRVGPGNRPPAQKNEVSTGYTRVIDQIIGNPDRHQKNYLWAGDEQIPIDHGIINGGSGEPGVLTVVAAKTILNNRRTNQAALAEIRQKISELTEQQIDRIADQLAQSFAVLEGATPADKVKIDNTVFVVRRNLKALRQAAEDIAAGRP